MLTYRCADCEAVQPPTTLEPGRCTSCGGLAYPTEAALQAQAAAIAAQNDRFRQTFGADPSLRGRVVATASVEAEGASFLRDALEAIRGFDAFTADNDPHGWHDFGEVDVGGTRLWWKIDLYDPGYDQGAQAPADLVRTRRLLTVFRPEEY